MNASGDNTTHAAYPLRPRAQAGPRRAAGGLLRSLDAGTEISASFSAGDDMNDASPAEWIDVSTPSGYVEHVGPCALLPVSELRNTRTRIACGGVQASREDDLPVTLYHYQTAPTLPSPHHLHPKPSAFRCLLPQYPPHIDRAPPFLPTCVRWCCVSRTSGCATLLLSVTARCSVWDTRSRCGTTIDNDQ